MITPVYPALGCEVPKRPQDGRDTELDTDPPIPLGSRRRDPEGWETGTNWD